MSAPLTTRDALLDVLHRALHLGGDCAYSPESDCQWRKDAGRQADALLASGALIDATKFAEDEALVERVIDSLPGHVRGPVHLREVLTALSSAVRERDDWYGEQPRRGGRTRRWWVCWWTLLAFELGQLAGAVVLLVVKR